MTHVGEEGVLKGVCQPICPFVFYRVFFKKKKQSESGGFPGFRLFIGTGFFFKILVSSASVMMSVGPAQRQTVPHILFPLA